MTKKEIALGAKLLRLFEDFRRRKPSIYFIPEAPRRNTLRLFTPGGQPPFKAIGDNEKQMWNSLPSKLDLKMDFWNKTPLTDEQLWLGGSALYIIPKDKELVFALWDQASLIGPALYAEDGFNDDALRRVDRARLIGALKVGELEEIYRNDLILDLAGVKKAQETSRYGKPRRGRPPGSKNKKRVKVVKDEEMS